MKTPIYLTDIGLNPEVFKAIIAEHKRQLEKWGHETATPHEWLGYLTEEIGELAQAINKIYSEFDKVNVENMDIYGEAVQVATLACKIAVMHGPKKGKVKP